MREFCRDFAKPNNYRHEMIGRVMFLAVNCDYEQLRFEALYHIVLFQHKRTYIEVVVINVYNSHEIGLFFHTGTVMKYLRKISLL